MTEEQNVVNEVNTDVPVTPKAIESNPVVNTPVEQEPEKMLTQSKVNEIVGATKKSAYDKAYQDAMSKIEAEKAANASHEAKEQTSPNVPDIGSLVGEEISKHFKVIEEAQRAKEAEENARATLDSLKTKVDSAASKYEDFEDVTKDIPYASFPHLLNAADSFDNAGDLLYHLGKNPNKFRELATVFDPSNPMRPVAMKELKSLSDSLKNNEAAMQKNMPRSPLSQVRPSNVGTDKGKLSRADLRRKYTV